MERIRSSCRPSLLGSEDAKHSLVSGKIRILVRRVTLLIPMGVLLGEKGSISSIQSFPRA